MCEICLLCDGGFGGCEIPFGSERDLLRKMEGNVVGAFFSLYLIFLLPPLCLISANMEGLFPYSYNCSFTFTLIFVFLNFWIWVFFLLLILAKNISVLVVKMGMFS